MIILTLLLTILIGQRLTELALAKRNYRWAMRHGGREYGADHYWLFIALHSLWMIAMIIEYLFLQPRLVKLVAAFSRPDCRGTDSSLLGDRNPGTLLEHAHRHLCRDEQNDVGALPLFQTSQLPRSRHRDICLSSVSWSLVYGPDLFHSQCSVAAAGQDT